MAPPAARKPCLRKNHGFRVKVASRNCKRRIFEKEARLMKMIMKRTTNGLKLSELPDDLLGKILSGLHSADRVRFGASCKRNYSLVTTTDGGGGGRNVSEKNHHQIRRCRLGAIDEIPWLATFEHNDCDGRVRLYDPIHRRGQPPYATYEIEWPTEVKGFTDFRNRVKACKNGWLLFLWPTKKEEEDPTLKSLLMFSPFNGRFIKLPDLIDGIPFVHNPLPEELYDTGDIERFVTFSSDDPSSQDCVYFVLTQNVSPRKISISTLLLVQKNSSEDQWKTHEFAQRRITCIDSVAYHDGCFYCVSSLGGGGNLAAYDPAQETWTRIISSSDLVNPDRRNFIRSFHILECDAKLLLVCLDTECCLKPKKINHNEIKDKCSLFEFNSSTRSWVQKTSLGDDDHAIFIAYGDCSTSYPFSVRCSPDIANKVYYYCSNNLARYPKYYSFKDGQSYPCRPGSSSYWSSDIPLGIWIQPPPPALCIAEVS